MARTKTVARRHTELKPEEKERISNLKKHVEEVKQKAMAHARLAEIELYLSKIKLAAMDFAQDFAEELADRIAELEPQAGSEEEAAMILHLMEALKTDLTSDERLERGDRLSFVHDVGKFFNWELSIFRNTGELFLALQHMGITADKFDGYAMQADYVGYIASMAAAALENMKAVSTPAQ